MSELRYVRPADDGGLEDWRYVHNLIIPSHELSLDEVRERAQRNRLEVAYLGGELIGCTTVRPPASDSPAVTVIARVLAARRRQGFGEKLYARALEYARGPSAPTQSKPSFWRRTPTAYASPRATASWRSRPICFQATPSRTSI